MPAPKGRFPPQPCDHAAALLCRNSTATTTEGDGRMHLLHQNAAVVPALLLLLPLFAADQGIQHVLFPLAEPGNNPPTVLTGFSGDIAPDLQTHAGTHVHKSTPTHTPVRTSAPTHCVPNSCWPPSATRSKTAA